MATVELITKNAQGGLEKHAVGLPIGTIFWTAAKTPPPHSLAAHGSNVSRTTYAKLFAAIGTTWGAGNGSTTFTLPDARGRVPWGDVSEYVGTYYSAGLPNISGEIKLHGSQIRSVVYSVSESFESLKTNSNATNGTNVIEQQSVGIIKLNASRSSAIYGASTTVQPPALVLLPCIVYE